MDQMISSFYRGLCILNPDDGAHYFFGYYDMRSTQGEKHLCHRVRFMDRLPQANDVCELGYLKDGRFFKFAETTAWNFQQGAMLQYHPQKSDTVYYNTVLDDNFVTATQNYSTGQVTYTDRATACVSPDGKWGLGIHFGRIYAFRPGYGYAGCIDANASVPAPQNDGVFLVDMESGRSRLLISYADLAPLAGFGRGEKILVNHITFNPASDRFIMLVRNFRTEQNPWWSTSLVVSDLLGNCHTLLKNTYVSHYDFLSSDTLLAHCTVEGEKKSMYAIQLESGAWTEYDMPYFHGDYNPDIHCNHAPDGIHIIGDGYPINGYRSLMAYNMQTQESRELLRVKTQTPGDITDIRCDLHARFAYGGSAITFDTVHRGKREIAAISLAGLDF